MKSSGDVGRELAFILFQMSLAIYTFVFEKREMKQCPPISQRMDK